MVAHTFDSISWEAEVGEFLSVYPGLQNKFQDNQSYTEKTCLEKHKQTNKIKKAEGGGESNLVLIFF